MSSHTCTLCSSIEVLFPALLPLQHGFSGCMNGMRPWAHAGGHRNTILSLMRISRGVSLLQMNTNRSWGNFPGFDGHFIRQLNEKVEQHVVCCWFQSEEIINCKWTISIQIWNLTKVHWKPGIQKFKKIHLLLIQATNCINPSISLLFVFDVFKHSFINQSYSHEWTFHSSDKQTKQQSKRDDFHQMKDNFCFCPPAESNAKTTWIHSCDSLQKPRFCIVFYIKSC